MNEPDWKRPLGEAFDQALAPYDCARESRDETTICANLRWKGG